MEKCCENPIGMKKNAIFAGKMVVIFGTWQFCKGDLFWWDDEVVGDPKSKVVVADQPNEGSGIKFGHGGVLSPGWYPWKKKSGGGGFPKKKKEHGNTKINLFASR